MEGYVPISISHVSTDILKYNVGSDNGFDEIAFKPGIDLNKAIGDIQFDEIVIIEAKPKNPSISLGDIINPTNSNLGQVTQMSDPGIEATARKLVGSGDSQKMKLGQLILTTLDQNRSKLKKAVVAVDK